jgi:hypothetical protein
MKDQIKTTSENCSYEHVCVLPVLWFDLIFGA